MSTRLGRSAGDTAALLAGRATGAAVAVVTLRLAAARYGATRWGEIVTAVALTGLVTAIVDGGLFTIATREIARPDPDGAPLVAALTARLLIGVVAAPVLLAAAWTLYPDARAVRYGVAVLSPGVVFDGCRQAASALYVGLGRSRRRAILDGVGSLPPLVAALVAVAFNLGPVAFLATGAAGQIVVAIVSLWLALRHVPQRRVAPAAALRSILITAGPLAAVAAINVVYFRVDSVLLSLMRSSSEVGLYGVAYSITGFVMAVPSFFMLALLPRTMHASAGERSALATQAVDRMAAVAVPVAVIVGFLAHPALRLLAGPGFVTAAGPLSILMVGAGLSFVSAVFGNLLVADNRQRQMLPVAAMVAGTNLVLNLSFIPAFGARGAAAAMACSESVALVAVWALYRRTDPNAPRPARLWRPALLAAVMVAAGLAVGGSRPRGAPAVASTAAVLTVSWGLCATRLGIVPWRHRGEVPT